MPTTKELQVLWRKERETELSTLKENSKAKLQKTIIGFFFLILAILWVCYVDKNVEVEPTWFNGYKHERVNGTYLFAWFVLIIIGVFSMISTFSFCDTISELTKAKNVSEEDFMNAKMREYRQSHVQCPNCLFWFEDNSVTRQAISTLKNAGKFAGLVALKQGGSLLAGLLSDGNEYATKMGSRAGGEIAKSLGMTNYNNAKYECPECKHQWD